MSKLSQEIKEYVSCPQTNGKPYGRWGTLNSQQRIKIWNLAQQCEVLERVADDTMKELTKYKRAFEILKEYSHLPPLEKFVYEEDGNYYSARIEEYDVGSDIPVTYHYLLDKEEYELLEELM